MDTQDEVQAALSAMILSHSGWRGVFAASGDEEDRSGEISAAHRIIAEGAAAVFAEYLRGRKNGDGKPLTLIGVDTRPTGKAIAETVVETLQAAGCDVRYAGIAAAPEMMAWARSLNRRENVCGFIYISASHNPIGHNGFKFGLSDGGVLPAEEAEKLTVQFRSLIADPAAPARLEKLIAGGNPAAVREIYTAQPATKKESLDAYFHFCGEVAWDNNAAIANTFRRGIAERPLGICCDFNGSARCVSIDENFFNNLGIQCKAINAQSGAITHRIVPEGDALDPCREFLEEQHRRDPAFVMGYVPDCDGDRGNVVIWDENLQKARALEAQEVFALACIAELAQLAWAAQLRRDNLSEGSLAANGGITKTAVAVNDPTSLRIDRIAGAFGAEVFRAEAGEANVVGLARALREKGYTVRILGEGSAGGNITHPSAVRDPLHTVLALTKLLSLRSANGRQGLFELWCGASGQMEKYHAGYDLAGIIASLPPFITTGAYSPEALLKITSADHGALKSRYQGIFLREWEERKDSLKARYGIHYWEASAYNGITERKGISDFGEAGKGGLKICFYNAGNIPIASLWMRGSATEPVFRIMADAEGSDHNFERGLIDWQRRMTMEADRS